MALPHIHYTTCCCPCNLTKVSVVPPALPAQLMCPTLKILCRHNALPAGLLPIYLVLLYILFLYAANLLLPSDKFYFLANYSNPLLPNTALIKPQPPQTTPIADTFFETTQNSHAMELEDGNDNINAHILARTKSACIKHSTTYFI